MARPQARLGDISSHGGTIISGSVTAFANGKPVARMFDLHACPIHGHGVTPIITGSLNTATDGRPNARMGDIAGCGAVIVTGSLNVSDN